METNNGNFVTASGDSGPLGASSSGWARDKVRIQRSGPTTVVINRPEGTGIASQAPATRSHTSAEGKWQKKSSQT